MNNKDYATTLYVADLESLAFLPLEVMRESIWKYLNETLGEEVTFVENSQNLVYNGTLICFRVRDLPEERKILLSFFPIGEDISRWFKKQNLKAAGDVLGFCERLGEELSIKAEGNSFQFKAVPLQADSLLDISDWEVILSAMDPPEKISFGDMPSGYGWILDTIPTDTSFMIFTEKYKSGGEPISALTNILEKYGSVERTSSLFTARSFADKANIRDNTAYVFMDESYLLKQWYETQKIYFDSNKIPTQFIIDNTVTDKLVKWPGTRANLILEIMTKMGKPPLILRPPEDIVTCDGFLCLSDIESTTRRLFGALFCYSKEGLQAEEEVHIYDDIEFTLPEYEKIDVPIEKLDVLSGRISNLIGKDMEIDILITKEWRREKLNRLIGKLKEKGIKVQKVYYISTKTSRFTDEYITAESGDRTQYPYTIIGDKTAFLRTSTGIRIYPNLSHLFIRLMWPEDVHIGENDLKKVLWLVKKRIYRIQELDVLKLPEPMLIFGNVNKMYLGKFQETLSLPLRLLI